MISKRKLTGVLSLFLAVFFLTAAGLQAKTTYLGLDKRQKSLVHGRYLVEVYKDHKWQRAGALGFNQFYSDQEINLGQLMTGGVDSRIRIIQEGGGAAHLDSVFLGGKSPLKAEGLEGENVLKKLSLKDFDVIDAHERTFVLTFPASGKDKTLTLTARVEGTVISKTPFQFPVHNLYRRMNEGSQFYEYKLGAKETGKPFFKEFSRSGSGHPSAFTYGYVKDDGKYLLATIDFTGDNTRDGNKDYAKVYVKTDTGLKEFKVSENETRWGKPSFTYTDKVAYQHKVYNFKIPLKELGVTKSAQDQELELAFAAYGTDYPIGPIRPDLAFDPQTGLYLMVFLDYAGSGSSTVRGRMMNADGTPSGADFQIGGSSDPYSTPTVAYDNVNHVFLTVWSASTGLPWPDQYDIHGRFVNNAGVPQGTGSFAISSHSYNQSEPEVAFDSNNNRFLVIWGDYRNNTDSIHGQLVDSTGPIVTNPDVNFPITNTQVSIWNPTLTFDSVNSRFLVAYIGEGDIKGQLVNANGSLFGSEIPITNLPSGYANNPTVGYDSRNGQFLVIWNDDRNYNTTGDDLFGQLLHPDGSLIGSDFDVLVASNDQSYPDLAYDSYAERFLAVWTHNPYNPDSEIFGRYIYPDLTRSVPSVRQGPSFLISDSSAEFTHPAVAFNSDCRNFLTAYDAVDSSSYTADIALTPVGQCVSVPATQTVTLSPGTTVADYRILSFGLVPANPDPTSLIGEQIGTYDPTLMRIAHYENDTGTFSEYPFITEPGDLGVGPGDAAWFLFRFGKTLTFTGFKTPVEPGANGLNGYHYYIGPGWNQLGNPFDFEISVESIYVGDASSQAVKMTVGNNQVTQRVFWIWVNGEYVQAATLPPGTGGWVLKKTAGYGFVFFAATPVTRSETGAVRVSIDGLERPPGPPGVLNKLEPVEEKSGGCFISAADEYRQRL